MNFSLTRSRVQLWKQFKFIIRYKIDMDKLEKEASNLVKVTYVRQGIQNLASRQQLLKILLTHKKLPVHGWDDSVIEFALTELAAMDSNNFMSNVGVGEREGRVYSEIIRRRHFRMSHGIGRSGDIAEIQPKAAGSSLLYKIAVCLAQHALHIAGLSLKHCVILPLATGMSLTMSFLTLRWSNPAAKYIIWSRIDQKSCFKSIRAAGFEPLVVELLVDAHGAYQTNVTEIKSLLELHGDSVLCVLTTTSCFAPRQPDAVDEVAKLCKSYNRAHVINNAYGVQCPMITKLIMRATVIGRVDYIVQSTDKNFQVPVGGSIVVSPDKGSISKLSAMYPGRASMAPVMDLFITLLSMGEEGFRTMLEQRLRVNEMLKERLCALATKHGESLLPSPGNGISTAMSLANLDKHKSDLIDRTDAIAENGNDVESAVTELNPGTAQVKAGMSPTFLGAMLFQRGVSGCRVVPKSKDSAVIEGHSFIGWGSHNNSSPCSYLTAAVAVGTTLEDVNIFLARLDKVMEKSIS